MLTNAVITDCAFAGSISFGIADQIELRDATYANDTGYASCNYTVERIGYPDDITLIEDGATDNLNNGLFVFNTESNWNVGNYEVKYFCLGNNALTNRAEFSFPCRTFHIISSGDYVKENILSRGWNWFTGGNTELNPNNPLFSDVSGKGTVKSIIEGLTGIVFDGFEVFWDAIKTVFLVISHFLTFLLFLVSIIVNFFLYFPYWIVIIEAFICTASFGKDPLTNIETFINLNVIFVNGLLKFSLLLIQGLINLTIGLLRTIKGFAPGG